MNVIQRPTTSANWTPGRGGHNIDMIILHTMVGTINSAYSRFNNSASSVSVTYGVALDGHIEQYVSEGNTAWGAGDWPVNQRGINIEHEDNGDYNGQRSDALYEASAELVADICRRYGVPCQLTQDKTTPGIKLHKWVSDAGTACPDALDCQRIVNRAREILGGTPSTSNPLPVPTDIAFTAQGGSVRITSQTLNVRSGPGTNYQGQQANTPDGQIHAGQLIDITGFTQGEDVNGNNIWLRSVQGHWFWSGGTDFNQPATAAPAPATPAVDYTPADTTIAITSPLNARMGPSTDYPVVASYNPGSAHITGYVHSQNINGNDVWVRSDNGHWASAAYTNFAPPAIEPAAPAPQPATPAKTDYEESFVTNRQDRTIQRDTEAVDVTGSAPPVSISAGATFEQAGTFTDKGVSYSRSVYSVQHNTWYGVPEEAFTPIVSQTSAPIMNDVITNHEPTINDMAAPDEKVKVSLTFKQQLTAFFAQIANLFTRSKNNKTRSK